MLGIWGSPGGPVFPASELRVAEGAGSAGLPGRIYGLAPETSLANRHRSPQTTVMIERLVNLVFPPRCVFCNGHIGGGLICTRCNALLPRLGNACDRCAAVLPENADSNAICGACQVAPPPFSRSRAVFEYAFPIDSALKSLKFNRRLHYVPFFAAALLDMLRREFPDVDALVPVPLHRWRHVTRGFNQARELTRPIARATKTPVLGNVHRTRRTLSQSGLTAAERRRNLARAFVVDGRLKCSRPLIVDDVMTTGETCRQVASALLVAGAKQVDVLTVARA